MFNYWPLSDIMRNGPPQGMLTDNGNKFHSRRENCSEGCHSYCSFLLKTTTYPRALLSGLGSLELQRTLVLFQNQALNDRSECVFSMAIQIIKGLLMAFRWELWVRWGLTSWSSFASAYRLSRHNDWGFVIWNPSTCMNGTINKMSLFAYLRVN